MNEMTCEKKKKKTRFLVEIELRFFCMIYKERYDLSREISGSPDEHFQKEAVEGGLITCASRRQAVVWSEGK